MKRLLKQLRNWGAVLLLGLLSPLLASAATGTAVSPLFTVDLRAGGVGLTGISITGDTTTSAGQVKPYRAFAQFADGSQSEVTAQVQWSVLEPHPPSTYFGANELTAGTTEQPQAISIQAAYAHRNIAGDNSATAKFPLTIQPVPSVSFSYSCCREGVGVLPLILDISASAKGFSGTTTFRWDTDEDGLFDNESGQEIAHDILGIGQYLIGVKATDDMGHEAVRWQYVSIEKKPADEPANRGAVDVLEGSFLSPNGGTYFPDPVKADVGLVLIVHGMCNSATSGWPQVMGQAIQTRLGAGQTPNVCLYDWSDMANPSHFGLGTTLDCNFVETVNDLPFVRPYALAHGRILANWLQNEIRLGRARADRPIHIIGHSAGGFVGGECGLVLKRAGTTVAQVTMLDTPDPVRAHFTAYPNPGHVERYISSAGGRFAPSVDGTRCDLTLKDLIYLGNVFGLIADKAASCLVKVSPNSYYYRSEIPEVPPGRIDKMHSYAHDWYTCTITNGSENNGFWYSPWLGHPLPASASLTPAAEAVELPEVITNFQFFGTVALTGGVYTVVEGINAGIFKTVEMPVGAQTLRFRYQFAVPGDGDFLSVHWGTNALLYVGLDNLMSRTNFIEAEAPLAEFAGQTNELIFKLISRGATNAVLLLDQIELTISDDPDGDGLTTTQELSLGSDPLRFDTDGDGLNDGNEVNIHHTDPLHRDSDGDGISDLDEMTAGTDPLSQNSALKITSIRLGTNQTVTLEWLAATNRFYRVNRASTPQRGTFSTRTNGLLGQVPFTTFSEVFDTNVMQFYWVELE